ncbi:MFS transporter [Sphingobacterium faecale]|uniref:MFS transporter n=1 Tax=Sphingobacterium faecale TaxID=2803775 RepID=A0ABS1R3Q4_9SPHI|nr:MFS transporter [Sphingobacterium faecale]MBL1409332.1 MFS transporter [Sphingobacterium faecale]
MRKILSKPENRRWLIVAVAFITIVINYIDRQIVSILKPILKVEFNLDDSGYAIIVNIFTICYATMYPVTGWLVDKFGPKKIMFWGIITWSMASIGGGIARTVGQFGFFRGLLGLAEPTNFPSTVKITTIWFPGKLRATANSLCQAGGSIGAIIAPPIIAWLTIQYGWQSAFIVMGVLGILIAFAWFFIYKEPPMHILEESVPVAKNENAIQFSWLQLWKTRSLWGILLIRFISDPVWYFCLFWLPGYLQEDSGLSLAQVGMFGWIPFLLADFGAIGSSAYSDSLVRKGYSPLLARKRMLSIITCLMPLCILTPFMTNAAGTLIVFSIIAMSCFSWLLTMNVVVAEAFPIQNVASVIGIAGGFGALGAVVFNTFVGSLIGTVGADKIFFAMAALHPIALLLLWTFVRKESVKSINHN